LHPEIDTLRGAFRRRFPEYGSLSRLQVPHLRTAELRAASVERPHLEFELARVPEIIGLEERHPSAARTPAFLGGSGRAAFLGISMSLTRASRCTNARTS
jgi:hypothetical protein